MRTRSIKTVAISATLALACVVFGCAAATNGLVPAAAEPAPAPAVADPTLAPVAFLTGSWFVEMGGERSEENWTTPAGGTMLATGRTVRGGKTIFSSTFASSPPRPGLSTPPIPREGRRHVQADGVDGREGGV